MRDTGFHPVIWVVQAIRRKLIPGSSAALVAIAVAGAVDADGRWCFLRRAGLVQRCGETLSPSTVGRALDELVRVGLIRKLPRDQVREFFADDLAAEHRSPDRLPNVLELLVPAEDFPPPALERINRVRAELGEEPITPADRPSLAPGATGHRARPPRHHDTRDSSPCTTDLSLDSSPGDASPSVRRRAPAKATDPPLLPHVPDHALNDPATDRAALERAARRVLEEGLEPDELAAVLGNATSLRRPFPALMRRLRSAGDARAFLDGRLGRGVERGGAGGTGRGAGPGGDRAPAPDGGPGHGHGGFRSAATIAPTHPFGGIPLPRAAQADDPFARPPEFTVDSAGTAPRTCPRHPAVRNVPGGTCRLCGGPCRSVPGELLHPPASESSPEPERPKAGPSEAGLSEMGLSGAEPSEAEPSERKRPERAPDHVPPILDRLITAPARRERPSPETPPSPRAPSPDRQQAVAALRRLLAENRANRSEPGTAARRSQRSQRFPRPPAARSPRSRGVVPGPAVAAADEPGGRPPGQQPGREAQHPVGRAPGEGRGPDGMGQRHQSRDIELDRLPVGVERSAEERADGPRPRLGRCG
jgi:DNA-binding transcriptional ArsR family regulator